MAKLTITLDTGNAAFQAEALEGGTVVDCEAIARAVQGVAARVSVGVISGPVVDTNGNSVGRFELEYEHGEREVRGR